MENRRSFMKKCFAGGLVISVPGLTAFADAGNAGGKPAAKPPERALVTWYSQTGHTGRIGSLIQHAWQKAGLSVDEGEYRKIDADTLGKYDLIAIGTPVQYMDVPINLQKWIHSIPALKDTPVAAFVTYGGHGDGQHNTACGLLERMTAKGGIPVGMGLFGNMSTFAPTWSMGNAGRILAFKDRPNEKTYAQARAFAEEILKKPASGQAYDIDRKFGMDSVMRILPQISLTKLMITNHHIDKSICVECGTCIEKCPSGAIDLAAGTVNSKKCLACIGCVNNCPVQAVQMNFMGKKVYGFNEFLKKNNITIQEPDELKT